MAEKGGEFIQPSRDQVVHDLAMTCVSGMVQAKVLEDSKDSYPHITASDLATEAIMAYKEAYELINMDIQITDK